MPTVLHRLARWAEQDPTAAAQRYKKDGAWRDISARDYMDRVYHIALFLESKGLGREDVTAVYSPNNPMWVHLQLGSLLLGAKSAGIYPNSIAKDVHYVLEHTGARVLGIKDREFYTKVVEGEGGKALPAALEHLIVFDGDTSIHPKAISYDAVLEEGRRIASSRKGTSLAALLARVKTSDGAFMIYTSGTTGNPKGAILSHENIVYTSDRVAAYWRLPMSRGSLFSFLPLCHVAETLQSTGVGISQRYTVNFATKFDLVSKELPEVEPTLLLCVPRLWEKMMEGVLNKVDRSEGAKKKLALWALAVGARVAEAKYSGRGVSPLDRAQLVIADRLVLAKVRKALGLGRAELLASGAAALAPHVSRWFRTLGLEILEDYGQTESTGVICMTEPGKDMAGTVGKPVPGMEMKLASDGEILTRGKHVFLGYYKDAANTQATLSSDGWLHTGDLGELDEQGCVKIRGRKKEIMKTSGGKMVAPVPLEEELKAAPEISQVCMVGDNRKYLSALITLSEAMLAELKDKPGALSGDVVKDPSVVAIVKKHVDALNAKLPSYEQIKRFSVLTREFSIEGGEMTPTLKMKRAVVERNFSKIIEEMYAGAGG